MFERFTDRARQAVALAADEARELGASHVGPEHILLGLLREDDTIAAHALDDCGVTLEGGWQWRVTPATATARSR